MKNIFVLALLTSIPVSIAHARVPCETQFNRLEELRISSFDLVATASNQKTCLGFAENFLTKAGKAPRGCAPGKAKAVLHAWADSYQNDTQKTLPTNPHSAYLAIKTWAHDTLKKKCMARNYE